MPGSVAEWKRLFYPRNGRTCGVLPLPVRKARECFGLWVAAARHLNVNDIGVSQSPEWKAARSTKDSLDRMVEDDQ